MPVVMELLQLGNVLFQGPALREVLFVQMLPFLRFRSGVASKETNYLINSWREDSVQPECSTSAQHGLCQTVQFVIADYFLADVESLPRVPNSK